MIFKSFKHTFLWLSGAGAETLEQCPTWEQRKYVAFGATILVPTVFAFISCAYAVSTLTDKWQIIFSVAFAWGFIILTIDRALLATYRPFQSLHRKLGQFALRIVVAALMGVTIAHPLTLLLFKDTIHTVIENQRGIEIEEAGERSAEIQAGIQENIESVNKEITANDERFRKTYEAEFLVEDTSAGQAGPSSDLDPETRAEMEEKIKVATGPLGAKMAAAEVQIEDLTKKYGKLQAELDFWQREFEREVNGQRSGIVGEGPRARSIREDQLAWRREEAKRVGEMLGFNTEQLNAYIADKKVLEDQIKADYVSIAADRAVLVKAERDRIAALKRTVQAEQASQFTLQQNAIRESIKARIDIQQEELARLQKERSLAASNGQERIEALKAEPRRDILTQTLALHGLFKKKESGGEFALLAYWILALLFMLVDTIPLIVKFFTKPGPYDALVDCEEVRFDRERKTFLQSYDRYMEELAGGRLLHLSPANKPLERSLIEGVDRSRAAKEFIDHLMDLESSFQEKIAFERKQLAEMAVTDAGAESAIHSRAEMLEDMSKAFYADLRNRMSSFFDDPEAAKAAAKASSLG